MKRFDCMTALSARLKDELVILSLGGSVDEWYNAAPHMRDASLFQQQLGCVTPQAFGPCSRIAASTHRLARYRWRHDVQSRYPRHTRQRAAEEPVRRRLG
jgi:hypothetical protein